MLAETQSTSDLLPLKFQMSKVTIFSFNLNPHLYFKSFESNIFHSYAFILTDKNSKRLSGKIKAVVASAVAVAATIVCCVYYYIRKRATLQKAAGNIFGLCLINWYTELHSRVLTFILPFRKWEG